MTFIKISQDVSLAIACDSLGAIGDKVEDVVKVPSYVVGRFTSRVALMEILAVGATPRAISCTISCELEPTGEGILRGVKDELKSAHLDLPMTISTEKNVTTKQTGLGVTVVGLVKDDDLRVNTTSRGDRLYLVGIPKVGDEVTLEDPEIATSNVVAKLMEEANIHDVIPIGSKGIGGEGQMLAEKLDMTINWLEPPPVPLDKTAGPATCILVTSPEEIRVANIPVINYLGQIF